MFRCRLLHMVVILMLAGTPGIAAAQLSMVPEADVGRHDDLVEIASDAKIDELFRRLDAQNRELSSLRQLVGVNPNGASSPTSGVAGAERDPINVTLLNAANRVKLHAGLDTLIVFSTSRPFPSGMPLLHELGVGC